MMKNYKENIAVNDRKLEFDDELFQQMMEKVRVISLLEVKFVFKSAIMVTEILRIFVKVYD